MDQPISNQPAILAPAGNRAGFLAALAAGAEAIGQAPEIGTLEPGKSADFVVLDGDPTADISAVSRVLAVFMAGQRYK